MKEAGLGSRVINFLVDTLIIFLVAYAFYKWWSFYVMYWQYKFFPFYMFFWITIFIYYTIFESIWNRTPGKFLSMTRVRNIAGGRPAWYQFVFRSIFRLTVIDCFFIPFLNRPLHDVLSKTRVVEA